MAQGRPPQDVLRVLCDVTRDTIGLVIPETYLVCGCSGTLCRDCRNDLQQPPVRSSPWAALRAAAWTCGSYSGARGHLILSTKERGSGEARRIMGAVFATMVRRLASDGYIIPPEIAPVILIPAPTRSSSRRQWGEDPITIACDFACSQLPSSSVLPLVRIGGRTRDSAELGASQRRRNLSGRIVPLTRFRRGISDKLRQRCAQATVILVDDTATTDAIATETELVAALLGIRIDMVSVLVRA